MQQTMPLTPALHSTTEDNIASVREPPRVSIGLPVYNGERYLAAAIESVLAQTYTDFELIIADNASTDGTEAICRDYAARDSRVRYRRNPQNLGAAPNYNLVFALARGAYFKWMAHDDLIAPTYLERCVAQLDADPRVVVCYPRAMFIDADDSELGPDIECLHIRNPQPFARYFAYTRVARGWINAIFGLIRADVLRKTVLIGGYSSSDMILLAELVLRGEFYEVPEFLFLRRDHEAASVQANRNYQERQVWFDPRNKGKLELTHWVWVAELLRVISRTPLPWYERLLCYAHMQWWLRRMRRPLFAELSGAARLKLGIRG